MKTDQMNQVKCRCFTNAPFSARQHDAVGDVIVYKPNAVDYHGPTIIPAMVVLISFVLYLYYSYWSYFQDIREQGCIHTHVIRDMYNPVSEDQFLVCISTGCLPGSGTDARVGFLLIGESGSLKYTVPEGDYCYSTGSEIWFVLSSDLNIGQIIGIMVNYDRHVNGSILYPWVLRGVVVYSMRSNHVITFRAYTAMGVQLTSIELPTVPHVYRRGGEALVRFWRMMRAQHTLGSVVFHRPGVGVTKGLSALIALLVVNLTCAVSIEILGAPTLVSHLKVLRHLKTSEHFPILLKVAPISLLCSMILNNVYR
ncbi:hypothetical protein EGW08_020622, partial [Elysia chlorotica]